jgi:hypothetical protein
MGLSASFERSAKGAVLRNFKILSSFCLVSYAHLHEKHCDGVTVTELRKTEKGGRSPQPPSLVILN